MSKPEQENTWNEIRKEGEAAGASKELHDTAKDAGLTQEEFELKKKQLLGLQLMERMNLTGGNKIWILEI